MDHNQSEVLQEGPIQDLWDNAKHKLSKLGSITKGGKYFGKKKLSAEAEAQLNASIEKLNTDIARAANISIKSLDRIIKVNCPDFPNVKEPDKFQQGVDMIAAIYDSIVAASNKKPEDQGYLAPDISNELIKGLRMYVEKMVDYDLASVYKIFKEEQEGPLSGTATDTKSVQKFKSNRAPIALVLAGVGLKGLEWLINYFAQGTEFVEVFKSASATAKPGEGVTQFISRLTGTNLSPESTGKDLHDAIAKIGGNNYNTGLKNLGGLFANNGAGMSPEQQAQTLGKLLDSNPNSSLGGIFNQASGTYGTGAGSQSLFSIKGVASMIVKKAATQAVKTVGTTAFLKPLAPWLGGLGLAAVAAGVTVKLLRMKGLKSSRMQVLNDLLKSMKDVQAPEVLEPIDNTVTSGGSTVNTGTEVGSGTGSGPGPEVPPFITPEAKTKKDIASFFKNIGKIKKAGLSEAKNLNLDSDLGFKKGQVAVVRIMLSQLIEIKKDLKKLSKSKDEKLASLANTVLQNPVYSEVSLPKLFTSKDINKIKRFFINFVETGNRVDLFSINEGDDSNDDNRKAFLTNYKKFLTDLYKVYQYFRYKRNK
jgi:hypothetical protein